MNWGDWEGQLRAPEQPDPGFPGSADGNVQSHWPGWQEKPGHLHAGHWEWGDKEGKQGFIPTGSEHNLDVDLWCQATSSSSQQHEPRCWLMLTASLANPNKWWEMAFPLGGRTTHRRGTPKELDSLYPWVRFTPKGIWNVFFTSKYRKAKTQNRAFPTLSGLWKNKKNLHCSPQHLPLLPENVILSRGAPSFLTALEQYSSQHPKPLQFQPIFPRSRVLQSRVSSVKTAKLPSFTQNQRPGYGTSRDGLSPLWSGPNIPSHPILKWQLKANPPSQTAEDQRKPHIMAIIN